MKIPMFQIDAFADAPFQGNPAAVCPLDEWLEDSLLQSIAEENNLAETAFYVKEPGMAKCRYRLRWFTPTKEVDLCGHATLAAADVLFRGECHDSTQVSFLSHSGELSVRREEDGALTLDFPEQVGESCEPPAALIDAMAIKPTECFRALDYMAVFESEDVVRQLSPDLRLLRELDLRSVIVTARGNEVDFVSRFFAPNFGVDEDPVTGSAHCTLAPYWADRLGKSVMNAKQLSRRTGNLRCRVESGRVLISGRTVSYLEGTIDI